MVEGFDRGKLGKKREDGAWLQTIVVGELRREDEEWDQGLHCGGKRDDLGVEM